MKLNNIKIGVLGGIGPETTSFFYRKLIEKIQLDLHPTSNTEFPQIIINSIPAPELIYSKNISAEEILIYKKGIDELNELNPDFIIMACNTIHLFYDDLQKESKSKIINVQNSIIKIIKDSLNKKICILGTPSTLHNNLYYVPEGNYLKLNKKQILLLTSMVENYNLGLDKKDQRELFNKLLKEIDKKCEIIVLGCTELSLLNEKKDRKIISSLDIMVNETIKAIKENIVERK